MSSTPALPRDDVTSQPPPPTPVATEDATVEPRLRRSNRGKGRFQGQEDKLDHCNVNGVEYKPGDYCYYEEANFDYFTVGHIEEIKLSKRERLTVVAKCFYRNRDIPETAKQALLERENQGKPVPSVVAPEVAVRELFISDVTDTFIVGALRGKCTVRHYVDLATARSTFRSDNDTFFYVFSYNPETRRLASTKAEIKVGSAYQAPLPELRGNRDDIITRNNNKERGRRAILESQGCWEYLTWEPDQIIDDNLENYLRATRSIVAFAGFGGGEDDLSSATNGQIMANMCETAQKSYDFLHQSGYNCTLAFSKLVQDALPRGGPQRWSSEEMRTFSLGIRTHGKDFHKIRGEYFPHRGCPELVEFYYYWKKTVGANSALNYGRGRRAARKNTKASNPLTRAEALKKYSVSVLNKARQTNTPSSDRSESTSRGESEEENMSQPGDSEDETWTAGGSLPAGTAPGAEPRATRARWWGAAGDSGGRRSRTGASGKAKVCRNCGLEVDWEGEQQLASKAQTTPRVVSVQNNGPGTSVAATCEVPVGVANGGGPDSDPPVIHQTHQHLCPECKIYLQKYGEERPPGFVESSSLCEEEIVALPTDVVGHEIGLETKEDGQTSSHFWPISPARGETSFNQDHNRPGTIKSSADLEDEEDIDDESSDSSSDGETAKKTRPAPVTPTVTDTMHPPPPPPVAMAANEVVKVSAAPPVPEDLGEPPVKRAHLSPLSSSDVTSPLASSCAAARPRDLPLGPVDKVQDLSVKPAVTASSPQDPAVVLVEPSPPHPLTSVEEQGEEEERDEDCVVRSRGPSPPAQPISSEHRRSNFSVLIRVWSHENNTCSRTDLVYRPNRNVTAEQRRKLAEPKDATCTKPDRPTPPPTNADTSNPPHHPPTTSSKPSSMPRGPPPTSQPPAPPTQVPPKRPNTGGGVPPFFPPGHPSGHPSHVMNELLRPGMFPPGFTPGNHPMNLAAAEHQQHLQRLQQQQQAQQQQSFGLMHRTPNEYEVMKRFEEQQHQRELIARHHQQQQQQQAAAANLLMQGAAGGNGPSGGVPPGYPQQPPSSANSAAMLERLMSHAGMQEWSSMLAGHPMSSVAGPMLSHQADPSIHPSWAAMTREIAALTAANNNQGPIPSVLPPSLRQQQQQQQQQLSAAAMRGSPQPPGGYPGPPQPHHMQGLSLPEIMQHHYNINMMQQAEALAAASANPNLLGFGGPPHSVGMNFDPQLLQHLIERRMPPPH